MRPVVDVVAWCVCLCWAHWWFVQKQLNRSDDMPFLGVDSCGLKEACITWGAVSRSQREGIVILREMRRLIVTYSHYTALQCWCGVSVAEYLHSSAEGAMSLSHAVDNSIRRHVNVIPLSYSRCKIIPVQLECMCRMLYSQHIVSNRSLITRSRTAPW